LASTGLGGMDRLFLRLDLGELDVVEGEREVQPAAPFFPLEETLPLTPAVAGGRILCSARKNISSASVVKRLGLVLGIGIGGPGQPLYGPAMERGLSPAKYLGVKFRNTGDPVLYARDHS